MAVPASEDGGADDRREDRHGRVGGADYLRRTLFAPAFPDLWEVRSQTEEVPVHGG